MQTSQLQGRSLIPLKTLENGVTVDNWYNLGKGEWGAEEGPVYIIICMIFKKFK